MSVWSRQAIYVFICLDAVVPLLLCILASLIFKKISTTYIELGRSLIIAFIGYVVFWLLGIICILIVNKVTMTQALIQLMVFGIVYIVLMVLPVRLIAKYNFLKSLILAIILFILQITIHLYIYGIILRR